MRSDFEPMERSSLADGLAQRLVQMIRLGVYKDGDRLPPISEMARNFGVGHPTLREALKQLEVIGIVDIKHGSGVYVRGGEDLLLVSNPVYRSAVSKKLMIDLIDARIPIETTSAGLAATNADESQLDRMTELLEEAEQNLHDDSVLNSANMSFHREISVASGNAVLAQLHQVLTNLFLREQRMILNIYGSREQDHAEHLDILQALRRQDADVAVERIRTHLEGVRDVLMQWDPEKTPIS